MAQQGLGIAESVSLDSERLVNEGILAEQFVAQELLASGPSRERPRLFYWLREKRAVNAEIDFVMAHGRRVIPLEVKAGPVGQLKSLWEFCKARNPAFALRLDAGLPSLQRQTVLQDGRKPQAVPFVTVPLYLASEIHRLARIVLDQ